MIYIKKGEANKICLTLSESITLVSPFFLFAFYSEFDPTAEPIVIYLEDFSTFTERYNIFLFTEGGEVELDEGQYRYEVWEAESEPTDLEDCVGIVEQGRMVVE